ncbi:tyrosine-type recombinase/integrase [Aestuariivirga litoralis]|uniref:tyrosine-type recombinase/integrase n=1 Tax=Aestuariivirga litoralis TaxID=2650924 RepID=UPI0018C678A9|nr:tyrosine-type recombinase/integrase [Aestuariivirga litoralis]MBG1233982.1 tyrosine-type recombinase/integrase [Aestuariivirga litoralis]
MTRDIALLVAESPLPPLVYAAGEKARMRFVDFFLSNIRNLNTRKAYAKAVGDFLSFCEQNGVTALAGIQPVHVAAYVELMTRTKAAPTTKQHLSAIRMLFDWLVLGQVIPTNPAHVVRGPKHSVRKGKTPVLAPDEARLLLDSIDISTPIGLRDRALIGLMVYSFARIGAAVAMRVEDVYVQRNRFWIRLHEKGGKFHELPCHHNLEDYLRAFIDGQGLRNDPKGFLFCTIGRGTGVLTKTPLPRGNAYDMVVRRTMAAGIFTKAGNHTFRATGITAYLKNGGTLEKAATIANHSSTRTTQLYDRRSDDVNLDEVERILI